MKYSKDEVLDIVTKITYEQVNKYGKKYDVSGESDLASDLGFDSLDSFCLVVECETYFKNQGCQINLNAYDLRFKVKTVRHLADAVYNELLNHTPELKDDGVRIPWGSAQAFDVEAFSKAKESNSIDFKKF